MYKVNPTSLFPTAVAIVLFFVGIVPVQAINWAEARPTIDVSLKMESEHLFRGVKRGGPIVNPGAWLGLYGFYTGAELYQPLLSTTDPNQVDLSLGYRTELITGMLVDVGATYRSYPDSDRARSREVYAGLEWEGLSDEGWLSTVYPRLYAFHDFDDQGGTWTFTAALLYDWYLSDWLDGAMVWLSLEPFVGWASPDRGKEWFFYGLRTDLNYALAAGVTVSIGGRYTGKDRTGGFLGTNTNNVWWGASLRFGF